MVRIEVLGAECSRCAQLYRLVRELIDESGLDAELHKVEDLEVIVERGVLSIPALVVDGVVRSSGRVPRRETVLEWIREAGG